MTQQIEEFNEELKQELGLEAILKTDMGFKDRENIAFLRDSSYNRPYGEYSSGELDLDVVERLKKASKILINSRDYEIFTNLNSTPERTLILNGESGLHFCKFKEVKKRSDTQSDIYLGLGMSIDSNIPYWEVIAPDMNGFNPIYDFSKQQEIRSSDIDFITLNHPPELIELRAYVLPLIDRIKREL